jgi:hypothetical protein
MDLKELESGVDPFTHWYYQSKKIPLLNYVDQMIRQMPAFNLIDIGAGSGFFSEELIRHCPNHIAEARLVDTGYSTLEINEAANHRLKKQLHLPEQISNSLLLLMDVLEHVPDDLDMLKQIKHQTVSGSNNQFFITVPAFESIWSAHDEYLGHYRRYTRQSLTSLLNNAGFQVNRVYYLYGTLYPLVYIKRKLNGLLSDKKALPQSDMKPLPTWLNRALLNYCQFEMQYTTRNSSFGLTCVAEGSI